MDLGCGQGAAARLIARAFPATRVVGVDIDESSIAAARAHPEVGTQDLRRRYLAFHLRVEHLLRALRTRVFERK